MYRRILFERPALEELKKEYALVDMHVHSIYSHDCRTSIKHLLEKAANLGIGVAVTDHIRAEGSLEALKQKNVMIIPGIEVNSRENKEILIYFYNPKDLEDFYNKNVKDNLLNEKIPKYSITKKVKTMKIAMRMEDIIDKAEQYNSVLSIPHPFTYPPRRSHRFFSSSKRKEIFDRIDAIEVMNASMFSRMNKLATNWAMKEKKAFTGGSDAHSASEIGHVLVACKASTSEEFLDFIQRRKNFVIGNELKFSIAAKQYRQSMKIKSDKYRSEEDF